ncbi:MAG: hypothetical protein ABR925_05560 [Acidimicrobiales bacterium]|jgi:hypothetical protein
MASSGLEGLLPDLNIALNEGQFCDFELRPDRAEAVVLLRLLALPEEGPEPEDRRVLFRLSGVGRAVASLRAGRWDDASAVVEALALDELGDAVRRFGGVPIYGWDFFDPEHSWDHWRDRLSLDVTIAGGSRDHVLALSQESLARPDRILDLRIWFGDVTAFSTGGEPRSLRDVADGGRRWWDAFYAGDPRTTGHGMAPLRSGGGPVSPSGAAC